MNSTCKTLLHTAIRLVAGCFLFSLPALFFWLDALDGGGLHENGIVEYAQVAVLALSGTIFAIAALRASRVSDELAPALLLVALTVASMVVRELDGLFDRVVFHGAWKIFAAPFALFALVLVVRRARKVLDSLAALLRTRIGHTLELFALALFAFSRTLGMKMLWETLFSSPALGLSEDNFEGVMRMAKNAMEEGTELYAYLLLFTAAVFAILHRPKTGEQTRVK